MYSTLDSVKEWITGISGNTYDAEIIKIQEDVSRDIDRKLALITTLPISDNLIKAEIAKFEARLSSLWFKYRRAGAQEREEILQEIKGVWSEFDEFVTNRFGYGVVIG